jgi:hypothetical protein
MKVDEFSENRKRRKGRVWMGSVYVVAGPYEMKDAQAQGGFRSGSGAASRPREGNERERRERDQHWAFGPGASRCWVGWRKGNGQGSLVGRWSMECPKGSP